MENLQEAIAKLKKEREEYIQNANAQIAHQIGWFDGAIAKLEELSNPPKEKAKDESQAPA